MLPRLEFDDFRDWFTDDERRSLFGTLSRGSSVRRNPSLLQRSLSLVSNSTAVPDFGKIDFSVDNLCKYINAHPSLQRAEIVATECYVGKGLVKHRFLVLELRRQGRKDMFLRLDRRRERGVSMTQFISLSGTTGANDLAQLAPDKSMLLEDNQFENRQTYSTLPTLGTLRDFLCVLLDELTSYRIWPENCWLFCSMIQQYLGREHQGQFVEGTVLCKPGLGREVRQRVMKRAFSETDAHVGTRESALPHRDTDAPDANAQANADADRMAAPLDEHADSVLNLGQRGRGCDFKQEIVRMHRQFYQTDPRRYRPLLADALRSLGATQYSLSLYEEARAAEEESVDLYRQLCAAQPDDRTNYALLAAALCSLGATLAKLCRHEEARAAEQECADLYRDLYTTDPNKHRPRLARALDNLAFTLGKQGLSKEARPPYEEAVVLYRQLYTVEPDKYRALLANATYKLGDTLHKLGLFQTAHASKGESVVLFRLLYAAEPEKHRARLADALCSLSITLDALLLRRKARSAHEEYVSLFRQLHATKPEKYCAVLAKALYKLGIRLHERSLYREARAPHEESVTLYRQLYAIDPLNYCAQLARGLRNLAVTLHWLSLYSEARATHEESVTFYRQCYTANPQTYKAILTRALNELKHFEDL